MDPYRHTSLREDDFQTRTILSSMSLDRSIFFVYQGQTSSYLTGGILCPWRQYPSDMVNYKVINNDKSANQPSGAQCYDRGGLTAIFIGRRVVPKVYPACAFSGTQEMRAMWGRKCLTYDLVFHYFNISQLPAAHLSRSLLTIPYGQVLYVRRRLPHKSPVQSVTPDAPHSLNQRPTYIG